MEGSDTGEQSGRPRAARASHYEYKQLRFSRWQSPNETRRALTDEAEYGRWELARTSLYAGGERRVWLRRRVIKVQSTLG